MYAVHAVPFGIVVGLLPFWYKGPVVATILFTASLVQAVDVDIGAGKKDGMMIGLPRQRFFTSPAAMHSFSAS